MSKLKVLYYIPSLESTYAGRFIYQGYKDAFLHLGHQFETYTTKDHGEMENILNKFQPDIFISSLNTYSFKYLDLSLLKKYRDKGTVMLTQVPAWKKHSRRFAGGDLQNSTKLVNLIKDGLAGDVFFTWLEQDDPLMEGFIKTTGYKFHTILLAANTHLYYPDYDERYVADISFVGSNLSSKRKFIKKHLLPLKKQYQVRTYGSDWTLGSKVLGYIQKAGQFMNIEKLKGIRKFSLPLEDERKVYTSSTISLNIHEEHQRRFGSDFNERTFKIIASGGFQIVDDVAVLRRYFDENELVIAKDTNEWFQKIDHYIKIPQERLPIIEAGRKKVLENHTYHHRVEQIVSIYKEFMSN